MWERNYNKTVMIEIEKFSRTKLLDFFETNKNTIFINLITALYVCYTVMKLFLSHSFLFSLYLWYSIFNVATVALARAYLFFLSLSYFCRFLSVFSFLPRKLCETIKLFTLCVSLIQSSILTFFSFFLYSNTMRIFIVKGDKKKEQNTQKCRVVCGLMINFIKWKRIIFYLHHP